MPCQKFGIDTPISENMVQTLSKIEYCRVADMIPTTIPMITEMIILIPASLKVVGKAVKQFACNRLFGGIGGSKISLGYHFLHIIYILFQETAIQTIFRTEQLQILFVAISPRIT